MSKTPPAPKKTAHDVLLEQFEKSDFPSRTKAQWKVMEKSSGFVVGSALDAVRAASAKKKR